MVAFLGFGVWAHHMFTVGLTTSSTMYFAAASLIIVIPSAIQLFAWITTILTGTPEFKTPLLFIIGFIVYFIIGGLSGITLAAIPFDQQVHDSYYVIAHFHMVIFGAAVYPILGGMYYWFPKVTGRMYSETWGKVSFWMTFVGTLLTFFPMHILGLLGMPRRNYTYPAHMGWTLMNLIESIGAYILGAGLVLIVLNLLISMVAGEKTDDPFHGDTLEWSASSPPPPYNFVVIPTVSSPYGMYDTEDRRTDNKRLARGEGILGGGHETPTTTAQDAELVDILDMPSHSIWPPVAALALSGMFAMLLLVHYWIAAGFLLLGGLALFAWHSEEEGE
jgi:cytochrome c oxidase subunit 1/cytochrome c oxidase subunit I+III